MPDLINWNIAKNPLNWLIVGSVMILFSMSIHYVVTAATHAQPGN